MCYIKNNHNNHKLIEINDLEALNKENIKIETSSKEFNEILQKAIDLKESILKEIDEINKLYDKVNSEITKSFEIKHEKLIKQENELKESLQNEVTKTKEKLENFLSESNKLININERISKGIKLLEKENEKTMIKILSYVSKMNKNKKKMTDLFKELIKNIKFSFQEEQSKIEYNEYYFNGIPIPKNIEIKNINNDNFKLFWNIDDINLINIDKNKIKFRIELRKDDKNQIFKTVYEGNDKNFQIQNLIKDTVYEIRICSVYNNLVGFFSQIKKVKTNNSVSKILDESGREKEFLEKIYEWCGYKSMELIYRGSRDGTTSNKFHEKCDNQGPTICLYQNEKGYIFGGFTYISWTSDGSTHKTSECFIFTLTNIHGTEPTKFPQKENNNGSVNHHPQRSACFGNYNDIQVYQDYKNSDSVSSFPCDFIDTLNKGKSIFTGDFNNNNTNFRIKELEVFKLFK